MNLKTPYEKMANDPKYSNFVSYLESMIYSLEFTPSEVREMAMAACVNFSLHNMQLHVPADLITKEDLDAFKHLESKFLSQEDNK